MPTINSTLAQLPSNPLFCHTSESLVENAAGNITSWNDISGNGYNATVISGSAKKSNQNSLNGLLTAISSQITTSINNINQNTYTLALLVQRNVGLSSIAVPCYLHYAQGLTSGIINYAMITNTQLAINFAGSTNTVITNPSTNLGNYLFVIIRYSNGELNYYINNCGSNIVVTKTSLPSFVSETWNLHNKISNTASAGCISNFEAIWNRSLTDSECLQISQYAFKLSGGQVGDNPNQLKKYKNISLPTGSLFLHTPDSIQTGPTGIVTSWNDTSGNNRHSIPATGSPRIFNQNGIQGLSPTVATSAISKTISLNPKIMTCVKLWQKSVNVAVGATTPTVFEWFNGTNNNYIYTSSAQIGCIMTGFSGAPGSIQNVAVEPGKYSLVILRYDIDNSICNFYINNTVTNISLAKQTTPSVTTDNYVFYESTSGQNQHSIVHNFSAAWNRYLSNDECLAISNYAYVLTNGQIGDKPINTYQITKLQSDLGAI